MGSLKNACTPAHFQFVAQLELSAMRNEPWVKRPKKYYKESLKPSASSQSLPQVFVRSLPQAVSSSVSWLSSVPPQETAGQEDFDTAQTLTPSLVKWPHKLDMNGYRLIYIHMYVLYIYVCIYVCVYVYTCDICVYVIYVCMAMTIYIYICMYAFYILIYVLYIYICMYICMKYLCV